MRRTTIWPLVWAVIALVVSTFGLAHAQETTTGSITGDVVDTQGAPVPGATVTVSSGQGDKSFVTDQSGRFFAPFLTPGRYSVRVELSGFAALEHKAVEVRLGQRIELAHLVLKVGGVEEVVDVVGSAPVVDTSSTTAGGVLASEQVQKLPVGRQMTDTLYMLPGVSNSGMGGGVNGNSNPSMSGGSGLENNYVVDGVNITNSGYGAVGSYSIIFGSLGSGVTTDFIQETQVKTAGFEAEYGQATGGVVNVVTKSGSNELHGSVYGFFAEDALEGGWRQLQTVNGSVNTVGRSNRDVGVTLGGPVVKNRLFAFGAFNPQYQTRTIVAPPHKPAAALGEVDFKRRSLSYAGKLTFQASSNHRVDATVFGDPSHGELGPQRANVLRDDTPAGANFSTLDTYGGHNQTVRYDGILSRSWLIEASVARATNKLVEIPQNNEHRVTDATVSPSRVSGGIGGYEQGNNGKNLQFSLKSTNIFDAAGHHQVRYGVAFEDINYSNVNRRTGPAFTLPNGQVTNSGASITITPDPVYGRIYRVTRANYDQGRITDQKYLNFFAQDTWQVGKLTLRPGLRWERQRLIGGNNPPLCHVGDSQPGAGDGTGDPVPCEFTFDNNWSPRLGATFDIKGDGKSKLYASWGRFYSKIPNDLAARALSADAGVSRADYFDAALTQPVPNGVLAGGQTNHFILAGAGASIVDADSRSTYSQEFVGGIELELMRNVNFGVRYIHRSLASILEDWQGAPVAAFDLGCPGTEGGVQTLIGNIGPELPRFSCAGVPEASFETPEHKYDSFEVTATRSFSDNWSLLASYRFSKLSGNFEGFFRNDNGQSDPAISSLFDFPTNDPSYTQIGAPRFGYQGDIRYLGCTLGCGVLPIDRPHQVKIYGTRTFGALNMGVAFNAGSGRPLTALAANPQYDSGGEIPMTERGAGIETVDGFRERTAAEVTFDLHADYGLRFGRSRVVLLADVFNLLNRREALNYDNFTQRTFSGGENLNFGQPVNGGNSAFPAFQTPRQVRLGARLEW